MAEYSSMARKLEKFELLPVDRRFLANMSLKEIFKACTVLESDPHVVWEELEAAYRKRFLEPVVFKRYSYVFNEHLEATML